MLAIVPALALFDAMSDEAGEAFGLGFLDAQDGNAVCAEEDGDVPFAGELREGVWAGEELGGAGLRGR